MLTVRRPHIYRGDTKPKCYLGKLSLTLCSPNALLPHYHDSRMGDGTMLFAGHLEMYMPGKYSNFATGRIIPATLATLRLLR